MADFKPGDAMRITVDARVLTPAEDRMARKMAMSVGHTVAAMMDEAKNGEELMDKLWLTPYALLYALHAAMEGVKAIPNCKPRHERLRDGIWKRGD